MKKAWLESKGERSLFMGPTAQKLFPCEWKFTNKISIPSPPYAPAKNKKKSDFNSKPPKRPI